MLVDAIERLFIIGNRLAILHVYVIVKDFFK